MQISSTTSVPWLHIDSELSTFRNLKNHDCNARLKRPQAVLADARTTVKSSQKLRALEKPLVVATSRHRCCSATCISHHFQSAQVKLSLSLTKEEKPLEIISYSCQSRDSQQNPHPLSARRNELSSQTGYLPEVPRHPQNGFVFSKCLTSQRLNASFMHCADPF
jgi:hypothetical protein